ncbi:winged helix-turn-helix transcriptional regulator [Luteibacter yeojuensis]|uniref:Helix-turn-helix transcriptional regulator n=1 Tax=Luteibacter yeojuensis TaxID=345309 RepID=A0A7X5QV66_9GAMM|nr:helix-turn-helix domain-containing protein [Luteibacter yeojuensis]NID15998.1 helix-turn-helix transcriptional regulator [Luteibacter yeojuensis]
MRKKRFDGMNCTIARALDQVGDWWTLLIVREATQGATRFDEFQSELGIARNILTSRLERLVELGIMERFPLENRANTDGYRLTRKGEDLYPLLVTLKQWGDRWVAPNGKPTTRLVTADSGHVIQKITVHGPDGKPLSFRDVRFVPGPGATANTLRVIESRNHKVLGEG